MKTSPVLLRSLFIRKAILGGLVLAGLLFVASVPMSARAAAAPFSDSFDSYALDNLYGQGLWQNQAHVWQVTDQGCYGGVGRCVTSTGIIGENWKVASDTPVGEWRVRFYATPLASNGIARIYFGDSDQPGGYTELDIQTNGSGVVVLDNRSNTIAAGLPVNTWHTVVYRWDMSSSTNCQFTASVDGGPMVPSAPSLGTPSNCYNSIYKNHTIGSLALYTFFVGPGQILFDDIGDGPIVDGCNFNCDSAISADLSNALDTSTSTTGWKRLATYNPPYYFAYDSGLDGNCHSGACIKALSSFNTASASYFETGVGRPEGAISLWSKVTQVWSANENVSLCLATLSDCIPNYVQTFVDPIPRDGAWHQLYLAWRQGSTTLEFCELVDTTDATNCSWGASSFPLGSRIDGFELYGYNYRPDLGDGVWFDDIKDESTGAVEVPPPSIAHLVQATPQGDALPQGAAFMGESVVLSGSSTSTDPLKLEVELKPAQIAFDSSGTYMSATSTSGELAVTADNLIPLAQQYQPGGDSQDFHWRARLIDEATGATSDWQEFGTSASDPAFTARVVPLWTQVKSDYPSTSALWASQSYASGIDHVCAKNTPGFVATIGGCGCLITSFVMLGHYYGIDTGVDGSPITPLTLNNWLEAHHGYVDVTHAGSVDENLLDYNAVRRYFGTLQSGKYLSWLQYHTDPATNGLKITDRSALDSYLGALEPGIMYNPSAGHYFVATAKLPSTYALRDPYFYNTQTLNDSSDPANHVHAYKNAFAYAVVPSKLSSPTPVLAYTTLYLASPAELLVVDPEGRREGKDPRTGITYTEIPGASYELSDPIATSEDALDPAALPETKVLTFPTPNDGVYTIDVIGTGTGTYQLTAAMMSDAGTTTVASFTASTTPGLLMDYTFTPAEQTVTLTPEGLLKTLSDTIEQANLKTVSKALLAHVQAIKSSYERGSASVQAQIDAMSEQVHELSGLQMPTSVAGSLLTILANLRATL